MPEPRIDPTPPLSLNANAGDGDSLLSLLELRFLVAIAQDLSHPDATTDAHVALGAYVQYLHARNAAPETTLICVKKLIERSAIAHLPLLDAQRFRDALVARAIGAYYDRRPTLDD